jgi:hypothetical protein
MKKIIIPILAIASLSLASCRKDRTCTCETTTSAAGMSSTSKQVTTISKANKRVAKATTDCYSAKASETMNGVTVETTRKCELK